MKSRSRIHKWFPNVNHKIDNTVKSFQNFENASNEPKLSQPHLWNWPTNPVDWVHKDYFEYNKNEFLIMVDSYSKWLDVEIVSHFDTKNAILCLSKWFSQYGIPVQMISDNETQLTLQEFENFI